MNLRQATFLRATAQAVLARVAPLFTWWLRNLPAAWQAKLESRPMWRTGLILAGALASAFAALVLLLLLMALFFLPQLPALDRVTDYRPRQPLQVLTRDGVEIAQFGSERRQFLPMSEMPQRMKDAVLAVEDVRFYEHSGLDFRGIARAFVNVFTRGRLEGASTITQQVARTFFLSPRRTAERKVKEVLLTFKIEQELSKEEILELYLNQIYLGQRAYGFGAAAQVYFGKPLAQLSWAECAMLAGLPKNPAFANPITNFAKASARQKVVLARLRDTGLLDEAAYQAALAEKLVIRTRLQADVHAEYVAEMARKVVYEKLGEAAYTQGIKVVTSLVAADQQAAYAALRRGLLDHERKQAWRGPEAQEDLPDDDTTEQVAAQILRDAKDDDELRIALVLSASPKAVQAQLASGETIQLSGEGLRLAQPGLRSGAPEALAVRRGSLIRVSRVESKSDKVGEKAADKPVWQVAQWPQAQGALVALDSATGRVRALVGGFDFTRQQFNHATQAWRQPGSSFKPFLYSAALEHGVMPATLVNDAPIEIPGSDWNPQNSDGEFDGPISLRRALAKSKNMVSIRLVQHMGLGAARDWVKRFGLDPARQPDNLTLALGAGSVTPMQMASAYAVLANGGFAVEPVVIERITDAQGKLLFEAPPPPALSEERRVIPAANVFITGSLLQEVTRAGTAARAQAMLKRADLYGKTGTTNDAVDAWFAGFQPSVVAVVWMGYGEPRSLGARESGGGLALPVWISYMERALRAVPVQELQPPEGVAFAGGDWVYSSLVEGGWVRSLGWDPSDSDGASETASTEGPTSAAIAASAASAL